MRPFISYIFIFSLLFMGMEEALHSAAGEHSNGSDYAHFLDGDDSLSMEEDEAGHCPNCCHGYIGGITARNPIFNCDIANPQFAFYQLHFLNYSQAPPTPPPNA